MTGLGPSEESGFLVFFGRYGRRVERLPSTPDLACPVSSKPNKKRPSCDNALTWLIAEND
jgi:hypothetical protein